MREPTLIIKNADAPKDLVKAFQDNRTSEVQILTKQNEIQHREAEAQAIAALKISGEDYVLLRGIEWDRSSSGSCRPAMA